MGKSYSAQRQHRRRVAGSAQGRVEHEKRKSRRKDQSHVGNPESHYAEDENGNWRHK